MALGTYMHDHDLSSDVARKDLDWLIDDNDNKTMGDPYHSLSYVWYVVFWVTH